MKIIEDVKTIALLQCFKMNAYKNLEVDLILCGNPETLQYYTDINLFATFIHLDNSFSVEAKSKNLKPNNPKKEIIKDWQLNPLNEEVSKSKLKIVISNENDIEKFFRFIEILENKTDNEFLVYNLLMLNYKYLHSFIYDIFKEIKIELSFNAEKNEDEKEKNKIYKTIYANIYPSIADIMVKQKIIDDRAEIDNYFKSLFLSNENISKTELTLLQLQGFLEKLIDYKTHLVQNNKYDLDDLPY